MAYFLHIPCIYCGALSCSGECRERFYSEHLAEWAKSIQRRKRRKNRALETRILAQAYPGGSAPLNYRSRFDILDGKAVRCGVDYGSTAGDPYKGNSGRPRSKRRRTIPVGDSRTKGVHMGTGRRSVHKSEGEGVDGSVDVPAGVRSGSSTAVDDRVKEEWIPLKAAWRELDIAVSYEAFRLWCVSGKHGLVTTRFGGGDKPRIYVLKSSIPKLRRLDGRSLLYERAEKSKDIDRRNLRDKGEV